MLPSKLKNFNVFNDGASYLGLCVELTPPKIAELTEEYRGAGMLGPVDVGLGLEKMEMEATYGGLVVGVMRQMGLVRVDGALLRFAGAYQSEGNGGVTAAELVVRGKHTELDMGKAKAGDDTEHKVKSTISYLKWTIAGRVEIEIDVINCVYVVGGIDRMVEIRDAIGVSSNPLSGLVQPPTVNVPGVGGFGIPGLN